jgi:hypothetical protein
MGIAGGEGDESGKLEPGGRVPVCLDGCVWQEGKRLTKHKCIREETAGVH